MKRLIPILAILAISANMVWAQYPYYRLNLDIQEQGQEFEVKVHQADTPLVRAFLYNDGERFQPTTNWGGIMAYGTNFADSTSIVQVAGTVNTSTNFIDFQWSANQMNTNGQFFCQIIMTNSATQRRFVFSDGYLHIKKNPLSGTAGNLVFDNLPTGPAHASVTYYSTNTPGWLALGPVTNSWLKSGAPGQIPSWDNTLLTTSSNIQDLANVDSVASPTTGQVLEWDGTTWTNAADTTLAIIAGQSINVTTSGVNRTIAWDQDLGSGTGTLSEVVTANITGLGTITGGVWNGTAIADAYIASTLVTNLNELGDVVSLDTPTTGHVLTYRTGQGWTNEAAASSPQTPITNHINYATYDATNMGNLVVLTNITAAATISAEHLVSTDDITAGDDITATGTVQGANIRLDANNNWQTSQLKIGGSFLVSATSPQIYLTDTTASADDWGLLNQNGLYSYAYNNTEFKVIKQLTEEKVERFYTTAVEPQPSALTNAVQSWVTNVSNAQFYMMDGAGIINILSGDARFGNDAEVVGTLDAANVAISDSLSVATNADIDGFTILGNTGSSSPLAAEVLSVGGSIRMTELAASPGTAADSGAFWVTNSATAEIYAQDGAGTETIISPHKDGKWVHASYNRFTGKTVYIDMEEVLSALEQVTGKKLMSITYAPKNKRASWDANEQARATRSAKEVALWETADTAFKAYIAAHKAWRPLAAAYSVREMKRAKWQEKANRYAAWEALPIEERALTPVEDVPIPPSGEKPEALQNPGPQPAKVRAPGRKPTLYVKQSEPQWITDSNAVH